MKTLSIYLSIYLSNVKHFLLCKLIIVVLLFVSCSKSNIGLDDPIAPKHSNVIMLSADESKAFKINTTNRVRISETDAVNMTKSFFFDKNKTKLLLSNKKIIGTTKRRKS